METAVQLRLIRKPGRRALLVHKVVAVVDSAPARGFGTLGPRRLPSYREGDVQSPAALVGRLGLALIFVVEGWVKIGDYSNVVAYMEARGVPGALLPLVIATELIGGLAVAIGLFARLAGLGLAGFCFLTALIFHLDWGSTNQLLHFLKNVAMGGGFLMLVAFGAGDWSIDGWRRRR